ncbi:MAG: GNAT family N-acetyltransferase [Candidatus Dependentiae bacterium]|nr:GNAT family N-acetyltransferase [Candidatus Dependentiae bacterium]
MIKSKQWKIISAIFLTAAFIISIKAMHNQKTLSKWFTSISKKTARTGMLQAHDKQGLPIVFQWYRTSLQSSDFSEITKTVSAVGIEAYVSVETQFLKQHPEAVSQDENFKSFEPLFKDGLEYVDWNLVENQERENLRQIFEMDVASLSAEIKESLPKDYYFFVLARDKTTSNVLGFIQFAIAPYYGFGDVKVITIAVAPAAQNRGLGKLLISSVFKIIPNIKRLFLSTRPTNVIAIGAYQAWGFIPDAHPIQDPHWKAIQDHWVYFEYQVKQTNILQKTAKSLKEHSCHC